MTRFLTIVASLCGASAIGIMALAAHGALDPHARELLLQAAMLQLPHAVMLFQLRASKDKAGLIAAFLFIAGIVLFCGGLAGKAYGYACPVPVIPWGGSAFIFGWLALGFSPSRKG